MPRTQKSIPKNIPEDIKLKMELIHEGAFSTSLYAPSDNIFVHWRNDVPLATDEDIKVLAAELKRFVDLSKPKSAWLADIRLARGNNTAAFESTVLPAVFDVVAAFSRSVSVTKTLTGAMQVQRIARKHGHLFPAMANMREAIAYAKADPTSKR